MKAHPSADAFPIPNESDFAALVDDIRVHGLIHPIVVHDGLILDGRTRWKACEALGMKPKTVAWTTDNGTSPTVYVISANLHRRHLTPSQKAAIAADLMPQFRKEAKERQQASGKEVHRGAPKKGGVKIDTSFRSEGKARTVAAKSVGVSAGYVGEAELVKKKDPELFEALKSGKVTLSAALKQVDPTPAEAVQKEPGMKWANFIADQWRLAVSIKEHGAKALSSRWSPEIRADNVRKLRRLAEMLLTFAKEME